MIGTLLSNITTTSPGPSDQQRVQEFIDFVELVKRVNAKFCQSTNLDSHRIQYIIFRDSMAIMDLEAGYRDWQANCIMPFPQPGPSHPLVANTEEKPSHGHRNMDWPPSRQNSLPNPLIESQSSSSTSSSENLSIDSGILVTEGLDCHQWLEEKYRDLRVRRNIQEMKCMDAERRMSMAQEQATVDEAEYSHLVRLLSQLFPRKAFRRQEILKAKVDRASYEVTLSSLAASRTNRAHQLLKEASTILAGESVPTVDATPCPKESSSSHHDRRHHKSHRGRKEHSMDSKETMSPLSSPIQSAHSLLISDAVLKYKLAHFILPSLPHVPKDTWHHIPIPMDEEEEEEEEEERKLVTLPSSPTPNHHPQHSKTISSVGQGQKKKGIRGILAPIFDHRHKHSLVKEEERAISDLIDKGLAQAQSESRTSKKETEEWTQVLDDRRGDLAHFWAEMVESI